MQNSNTGSEGTYHFGAAEDLIYLPNETRAASLGIFNVNHMYAPSGITCIFGKEIWRVRLPYKKGGHPRVLEEKKKMEIEYSI